MGMEGNPIGQGCQVKPSVNKLFQPLVLTVTLDT
jgi:hypothetical protein